MNAAVLIVAAIGLGVRLAWGSAKRSIGHHVVALGGSAEAGRMHLIRRGVVVRAGNVQVERWVNHLRFTAPVVVPSGLRTSIRMQWGARALDPPKEVWSLPIVRQDDVAILRADGDAVLSVAGLDDALARMRATVPKFALACDGAEVTCRIDARLEREGVDAIIDAVVALARYDAGLTETLASLDGATPLTAHELDPGVALGDDALVIGVRGGAQTIAQLDGVPIDTVAAEDAAALTRELGDGELTVTSRSARFTWAGVERDRDRLRAAAAMLRGLVVDGGPYL